MLQQAQSYHDLLSFQKYKSAGTNKNIPAVFQSNVKLNDILKSKSTFQLLGSGSDIKGSDNEPKQSENEKSEHESNSSKYFFK